MRKVLLLAAIVSTVVLPACSDHHDDKGLAKPTVANLAYARASRAERLDLFLPEDADTPMPLVIYVHGGGFVLGDKEMTTAAVQPLLDHGFAVASLNYRLAEEAPFPAAIQDVKAAVRWLRASANRYHLDPERFAAWGESAGANLAALLGATGDQRTVLDDPTLGNQDQSSAVQAVVDWFGPTDFLQMDAQAADPRDKCPTPGQNNVARSGVSQYMGSPIQDAPERVEQSNPITYIRGAKVLPPFSILHGTGDCDVPFLQSQVLADALKSAGQQPDLQLVDGAAHSDPRFRSRYGSVADWLDDVLSA